MISYNTKQRYDDKIWLKAYLYSESKTEKIVLKLNHMISKHIHNR